MATLMQTPREMLEEVASLRFPPRANRRLQTLMDRNTEGLLSADERDDLEAMVELSESLAVVRAKALHLLGRRPE
jgi:hypothetical protein